MGAVRGLAGLPATCWQPWPPWRRRPNRRGGGGGRRRNAQACLQARPRPRCFSARQRRLSLLAAAGRFAAARPDVNRQRPQLRHGRGARLGQWPGPPQRHKGHEESIESSCPLCVFVYSGRSFLRGSGLCAGRQRSAKRAERPGQPAQQNQQQRQQAQHRRPDTIDRPQPAHARQRDCRQQDQQRDADCCTSGPSSSGPSSSG